MLSRNVLLYQFQLKVMRKLQIFISSKWDGTFLNKKQKKGWFFGSFFRDMRDGVKNYHSQFLHLWWEIFFPRVFFHSSLLLVYRSHERFPEYFAYAPITFLHIFHPPHNKTHSERGEMKMKSFSRVFHDQTRKWNKKLNLLCL